jgi:hypothetical protein
MAVFKDRVQETSTTGGTGTLTLAGAVAGFRTFLSAYGTTAVVVRYGIYQASTGAWEVGEGTYTGSTLTLSRTIILASSNAGSVVTFTTATLSVWSDFDASFVNNLATLAPTTLLVRDSAGNIGGAPNVFAGSGFIAFGSAPATVGVGRLSNNQFFYAQDASAADRQLLGIDASGYLQVGGGVLQSLFGGDDVILGNEFGQIIRGGAFVSTVISTKQLVLVESSGTGVTCDLAVVEKSLSSNFTNATVTMTSSLLQFAVLPNETWDFDITGMHQAGSSATTTGTKFQLTGPAGSALLGAWIDARGASPTALSFSGMSMGSAVGAFGTTGSGAVYPFSIHGSVTNGANAGQVILQMATQTAGTNLSSILLAGAKLTARRTNRV